MPARDRRVGVVRAFPRPACRSPGPVSEMSFAPQAWSDPGCSPTDGRRRRRSRRSCCRTAPARARRPSARTRARSRVIFHAHARREARPSTQRVPDPGLPTLKRLPLKSANCLDVRLLARDDGERLGMHREHRAQIAVGAGSLNGPAPLNALYWTSDCAMPKSSSPALIVLTLKTEPPVDSTEQRMPCFARSLLTRRQIAPPTA